jgi:hypothetical protein
VTSGEGKRPGLAILDFRFWIGSFVAQTPAL